VLDCFPVGVVLVDAACNIVTMNRVAKEILLEDDSFVAQRAGPYAHRVDPYTLSLRKPQKLHRFISEAIKAASEQGRRTGAAMSLSRPSMRRPLSLLVVPLRTSDRMETAGLRERQPMAAIFVTDPERQHQLPLEQLTYLYGLTPAEAKLVQGLAAGKSLYNVAEDLGITTGTARSHLSRIYLKTDTHRQAELVQLVLTGPAALCYDSAALNDTGATKS
jgi:DNA-binding CsgD family transcriptional regulator